ncbi:Uncharacterised protein [Vibrio cholerae]|nr:Uncharacterised protein [Vibrio cholerae]
MVQPISASTESNQGCDSDLTFIHFLFSKLVIGLSK